MRDRGGSGPVARRAFLRALARGAVIVPALLVVLVRSWRSPDTAPADVARRRGRSRIDAGAAGPTLVVAARDAPRWQRLRAGYRCDGVDDHLEVQAALDAVPDGGTVMLTDGHFAGGQLAIPSRTRLAGQGARRTTYRIADGANVHGVVNRDTEAGNVDITVTGLTFDFNGAAQSRDVHGMRLERVEDLLMHDVVLRDAHHHNLVSIAPASGKNARWHIVDCVSTGAGKGGVDGDGFRPCDGFLDELGGASLVNCVTAGNSHHGFHLGHGCSVVDGRADSNDSANVYLAGDRATAVGVTATNHGPSGKPRSHNVIVSGAFCRVMDCHVEGSGSRDTDAVRVVGGGSVVVADNHVVNSGRYGIRLDADACVVERNVATDNAEANFFDNSPRAATVIRDNIGFTDAGSAT